MKIKNILIALTTVCLIGAFSNKAKAQIDFINDLPCYYLVTFISDPCPVAGFDCKSANYYYDMPNNYSWHQPTTGTADDQNGNPVPFTGINGICLKDYSTGASFLIDLCPWGSSGTVTIPGACGGNPLNVHWNFTGSSALLHVF